MARVSARDRNIFGLVDGRSIDSQEVPYPYQEHNPMRALQMHPALLARLQREKALEGHNGCVNSLAWNTTGSLLLSGSDDTRVNVWDYNTRKLLQSVDSGHIANIFCTKFLPASGDDIVVSGAGDSEVRIHRRSRVAATGSSEPFGLFRCHSKRVKKLAVEEGNPHLIWSASEDGTLRQHDLRQSVTCGAEQECRNILLDLRNGAKKTLSDPPKGSFALKSCSINPTRPHQILIGGSDSFARLYDRRMLPPLTPSGQQSKPPACVCYYCPMHLSDRASLHLTHVTFSPDGGEVLLSYSGEHVYLLDAYNGNDASVVYAAGDVPRRTALVPIVNGQQYKVPSTQEVPSGNKRVLLRECKELLEEARRALEEGNSFCAIETTSEVLETTGVVLEPQLRHDLLCLRAGAFVKRGWKNDMHMAVRDSNAARLIDPMSVVAHHRMAEALSQLGRHKEAWEFATRAHHLDPEDGTLSDHVTQLHAKLVAAEQARNVWNNEETKPERRPSRIQSLREFLFRQEQDHSDSSDESRRAERYDSDLEEEDMEMEIEMSVTEDNDRDRESGAPSSLNLRVRRKCDGVREKQANTVALGAPELQTDIAMDMRQRYVGHCNTGTDIKQASFLGERGKFVASGSDDGLWFIWEKETGRFVTMLAGDDSVVNCIQCHPHDCLVATSGIDNTIKLWSPSSNTEARRAKGADSDALRIMADNQQQMRRHREIGFLLITQWWSARRFEFMPENGHLGGAETGSNPPTECWDSFHPCLSFFLVLVLWLWWSFSSFWFLPFFFFHRCPYVLSLCTNSCLCVVYLSSFGTGQ
ncbi:WD and tetratricopeptide repeats protein 1 isoform X2 [Selaginella moellendorffii]|uniref:WD and tetratricopeptide repeats protein 1 isoform X2 n=1 Tax=Selaginella moellendorffii TaxID=88036 RepID=UPI000D1D0748|nr:WD and tetratricopeptide repeats protein 1 isoform X2 [Selaginella moellendorffii]|eukprot:XP_024526260.1 WD and tetratricopeptide repeats protein 1 isoform X2 [Selaginella moellendorffii]